MIEKKTEYCNLQINLESLNAGLEMGMSMRLDLDLVLEIIVQIKFCKVRSVILHRDLVI